MFQACPFDSLHWCKPSRILNHIIKCPARFTKQVDVETQSFYLQEIPLYHCNKDWGHFFREQTVRDSHQVTCKRPVVVIDPDDDQIVTIEDESLSWCSQEVKEEIEVIN